MRDLLLVTGIPYVIYILSSLDMCEATLLFRYDEIYASMQSQLESTTLKVASVNCHLSASTAVMKGFLRSYKRTKAQPRLRQNQPSLSHLQKTMEYIVCNQTLYNKYQPQIITVSIISPTYWKAMLSLYIKKTPVTSTKKNSPCTIVGLTKGIRRNALMKAGGLDTIKAFCLCPLTRLNRTPRIFLTQ